ncbi:ead/Ea22-like family protein [Salmonella enterica subsp. enterica]|uniref:ead/Ea22-like family protein n=1 Tax=Salmonella enterica TaxID=28901 RepID=UPI0009ABE258|nr:ead/Ea22-like family protein [Salmonella enterica]ECF7040967.1 ead/Ea22-like family protein [Salmonella enterica subsp. enterica]EDT3890997.1 ead/Ea22-like family protein [Salmonella enterica subsp. enterica serovar Cubana]HCL4743498.1 ead/Ea22-like family protein [Salmonella enterica]
MSYIDKQALREELSNPAIGSKDHLRKLALSLLDELDVKEEQRANWFQMAQKLGEDFDAAEKRIAEQREYYEGVIADGSKRIAELEARKVNLSKLSVGEVMHMSGFSRDYAEGWCAGNDNAIHEIRTAGVKVKEE